MAGLLLGAAPPAGAPFCIVAIYFVIDARPVFRLNRNFSKRFL